MPFAGKWHGQASDPGLLTLSLGFSPLSHGTSHTPHKTKIPLSVVHKQCLMDPLPCAAPGQVLLLAQSWTSQEPWVRRMPGPTLKTLLQGKS